MDVNDHEWLTPREVARLFRVDVKTVSRWAKAGHIKYVRTIGGHRRYRADNIRALMRAKEHE